MRRGLIGLFAAGLIGTISMTGCGRSTSVEGPPPDPTASRLRSITVAYAAATTKLRRPPNNLQELKPFLKEQGNVDELLQSPRDGQPFEIVWGVDLNNPPADFGAKKLVVAYEQQGSGGKRFVATQFDAVEMTEQEFAELNIPKSAPRK